MAVEKEIIVAIEFGSSKIRGMAGCKNIDGSVQVLDVEQVDARNCIRKGVVYNVEKTVMCLRHIVEKMETALGMRLCRAFVGIGGRSLKGKINTVSRQLVTKTVISQELVDSLLKNNENTVYAGCEILDVIPQEYRVGTEATTDPVGVLGNQIEGTFLNVVARTEVREYIIRCVEAAGLEVAGVFVSPMALAGCVLTDTERRSGCALVDFGYGTTTVAVYKNNLLRHLAVIPLGGNNITQDLCTQQMEEDEAEGEGTFLLFLLPFPLLPGFLPPVEDHLPPDEEKKREGDPVVELLDVGHEGRPEEMPEEGEESLEETEGEGDEGRLRLREPLQGKAVHDGDREGVHREAEGDDERSNDSRAHPAALLKREALSSPPGQDGKAWL